MDAGRRGTKFGLLALKDASTTIGADIEVRPQGEIAAHATCPIELPEHWQHWLGTLQTPELVDANLTIAIQIPSAAPDILDAETQAIEQRLDRIWHGLRLQGIPYYAGARIALGGINDRGELSLRRVSKLAKSHRHPCAEPFNVGPDTVRTAVDLGDAAQGIFTGNTDYRRLRGGYLALTAGMEQTWIEERLHQFVRALDGLMAIPARGGRGVFAERGQTFMTARNIHDLLVRMYVLRNTQEHLNDFRVEVNAPNEQEFRRIVSARSYQAEFAAVEAYRRVFADPAVRGQFISEASTAAFWDQPEAQRRAVWGPPFNLDAAEAEHDSRFFRI